MVSLAKNVVSVGISRKSATLAMGTTIVAIIDDFVIKVTFVAQE